jgi:hypothetical protein
MVGAGLGNMVVEKTRSLKTMLRLCPIIEQYRNGRKHLQAHFSKVHFFHPHRGIPTVLFYLAKNFISFNHPRTSRTMMLEMNELAIAKFLKIIGDMLRHDVRVDVNFGESHKRKFVRAKVQNF